MIEVIGLELEDIVVRVSEHFVNLLLRIINEFG